MAVSSMYRPRAVIVLLWLCWAMGIRSQAPDPRFTFPTPGQTFYLNDTVEVAYETNFPFPVLYTFCRDVSDDILLQRLDYPPSNSASAPIWLNFTSGINCWFNIRPDESGETATGANSEGFRFIKTEQRASPTTIGPDSASTVSSTISPTVSPTASTTSGSVTTTTTTTTTTSAAGAETPLPPSTNAGLSTGAQAGIGVGAGVGGLALGVIAAIVGRKHIKKRKLQAGAAAPNFHPPPPPPGTVMHPSSYMDHPPNPSSLYSGYSTYQGTLAPEMSPMVKAEDQRFRGAVMGIPLAASRPELDGTNAVHELSSDR